MQSDWPLLKQQSQSRPSILLLGLEGAGKKTLGIIASVAYKLQLVEFGRYFAKTVGHTQNEYIAQFGLAGYNEVVPDIVRGLLANHKSNCIITGLPYSNIRSQKEVLKAFAQTNPIVYLRREKSELQLFSRQIEQADKLYYALDAFYRSFSKYDYFNLSCIAKETESQYKSTLKLKEAEHDFNKFMCRVAGRTPFMSYARDPLSATYTYALQVPLEGLDDGFDYEQLECGADAINLAVTISETSNFSHEHLVQQMAVLRRKVRVPIILDIKSEDIDPTTYLKALRIGLRTLPDAVTFLVGRSDELEAAIYIDSLIKVVGVYNHAGSWGSLHEQSSISLLQALIKKHNLYALRVSAATTSRSDNTECFEFVHSQSHVLNVPLIAYNDGKVGRTSVCFNKTLSPAILPSAASTENSGITTIQARSALHLSFVLEAKKFFILGSSVSYSLSPTMHNAAYEACGLPHSYHVHQTTAFEDIHDLLLDPKCGGLAVSMPFKTQVLAMLDIIGPEARQIGAVNTVVIERRYKADGTFRVLLKGFNTDYIGIMECVTRNLSPANSIRTSTTALILGAGGMARAAIHALQRMGVRNICICNRTTERAQILVQQTTSSEHELRVISLEDSWPTDWDQPTIMISTIPAHSITNSKAHSLNIPNQWLRSTSGGTFLELAYKPLVTRFIAQMNQVQGWIVVDGLSVLLQQGVAQFELFTGIPAPVETMRKALRRQFETASSMNDSPLPIRDRDSGHVDG